MKCDKCLKQDTCKYYIRNNDVPCSHYFGLKGVWELMTRYLDNSEAVTDNFVKMYGEKAVFDKEVNL